MVFVDRKAKYPGRWTMIKSDGTSEIVTLVRNDEPEIEGTPMNAETLNTLSDVAGADVARIQAEAAREAAAGSATEAAGSASAAEASKTAAATSEANAAKHEEAAKKYSDEAGAKAGTDKTLSIEDAPADAAVVGGYILDRSKDHPELVFYSKAETDAKIKELLERQREEDYAKIKFWVSPDPTSPAEILGGTWERIEDEFILAAGGSYAAGSAGGEASHQLTQSELPSHVHSMRLYSDTGSDSQKATIPQWVSYMKEDGRWGKYGFNTPSADQSGYRGWALFGDTSSTGDGIAHNNMPPYRAFYVWQRIA